MTFPDQQTIQQVIQGDEAAFVQLCAHFRNPAFQFCEGLLKDEQEAEELIQTVFAKIWEERNQLSMDTSFQAELFYNLKNGVFRQMKSYTDAGSRKQYLDRIQARREPKTNLW